MGIKFRITSFRGDHNAVLEAPGVAEAIFNKLSGKTVEPLPPEIKTQVPDTFHELEALWTAGKVEGYTVISQDKDGEIIGMKDFNPAAEVVVAIAPIQGG